ncbi:uncharacterized protein LOC131231459 isoform X2 [Magnolia sinica]|uniref:uncharacterized protein LOC131231459 isoform X2 n=1 Tax=Magnolia sinica TaxID=86752 RepID=UPI00265ADC35|nr:uncharacterized protein LOC131231459 isoform X2 [Magnolia sinica]
MDNFCNNFSVEVTQLTKDEIEFDMIEIDASLANAFRMILITNLPTIAIEKVLVANNTSWSKMKSYPIENDSAISWCGSMIPNYTFGQQSLLFGGISTAGSAWSNS